MIIKRANSKQEEVAELTALLEGRLKPYQRFLIERELRAIRSGVFGEEDSAYYINFYFGDSKNWVVIHDLRIEYGGQVAQIDHLLINRMFDVYVLESKSYSYKIMISPEGDFQAYSGSQYYGIPSPIEQNKRHIHLLERFLKAKAILPKRMGISITPRFKNFILISPKSIIVRPPVKKFDASMVIKADKLRAKIDEEVDKMSSLSAVTTISKMSSLSTIEEVARRLAHYHRPQRIDYRAKFGLSGQSLLTHEKVPVHKKDEPSSQHPSKYFCFKCKKQVPEKVAKFCWQNETKFKGKAYCFDCQKSF